VAAPPGAAQSDADVQSEDDHFCPSVRFADAKVL
jgi:hypothetical protein